MGGMIPKPPELPDPARDALRFLPAFTLAAVVDLAVAAAVLAAVR